MYSAFRRISIMFNQPMHKVLADIYLFLISPACFDTQVS